MIKKCNSRELVCDITVVNVPSLFQWTRGLMTGSAAARLPGLQVCLSVVMKLR